MASVPMEKKTSLTKKNFSGKNVREVKTKTRIHGCIPDVSVDDGKNATNGKDIFCHDVIIL